ncbi:DUF599 domain-containing protein [Aliidiomarina halalkaliphila]|uniref:DUF599 domain-containing protein n=1 Tax=Aliidiomarina halalkaliphila TaxID=2593535 RepID=A0A552X4W9_9GAMM|nr:DUF599 domain-containing protein [Aliidiomarina halalkaliphila]TRW50016.1 DUF599 domain-containing protein [Aliidiomarina halalkaliphila]
MFTIPLLDLIAFLWFLVCWIGYSLFARRRAKTQHSLSSILCTLRVEWMDAVVHKEHHIADAALVGNVERTVTFFASSTIFVLAGVLTVIASNDAFVRVLEQLPFTYEQSHGLVLLKLAGIASIMVFAFFKFTWAVRQFGFVSILLGMAPSISRPTIEKAQRDAFSLNAAKVLDQAGHEYNYGLRAYYFALAYLCWFVSPWVLIASSIIVVAVLYRREYNSRVLRALLATHGYEPGPKQKGDL